MRGRLWARAVNLPMAAARLLLIEAIPDRRRNGKATLAHFPRCITLIYACVTDESVMVMVFAPMLAERSVNRGEWKTQYGIIV